MPLTTDDKQWIKGAITGGIVDALNEIVIPRFEEHDKRFDVLESDMAVVKRDIVELKEDVRTLKQDMRDVKDRLNTLEGEVAALTSDIKEIYRMIEGADNPAFFTKQFEKLSDEEKLLLFNAELIKLAKKAGVTLPRA